MLKEFWEDLAPWALRTVAGFVLLAILSALVSGVLLPLLGENPSSLAFHIAAGAAIFAVGVAVGATIQSHRAPARMYRYSQHLAPILELLSQSDDPAEQIASTVGAASQLLQQESKAMVVFAVFGVGDEGLRVQHSSTPQILGKGVVLPVDGRLGELRHRYDLVREDNLKRQASKPSFPADLRRLFELEFQSLRAVPVRVDDKSVAILVIASKKRRGFTPAEDRLLIYLQAVLAIVWSGQNSAGSSGK